jgi:hypothetical protein
MISQQVNISDREKYHLLGYYAASTLKMEAISSSETSVKTQRTTRCHIPEDDTLQNHRCVNLKSYISDRAHGLSIG